MTRPSSATGRSTELNYAARAGLLPELSRQTYDTFPKAVRESVLNSVDAHAERVVLDMRHVLTEDRLVLSDDGWGMDADEFREHFMSVGGSGKYDDDDTFGRIGIGSLALLQYGATAEIETKKAGSSEVVRARINHEWSFGAEERRQHLGAVSAGSMVVEAFEGDPDEHFTRISVAGLSDAVKLIESDPSEFFAFVESLRRILPLDWLYTSVAAEMSRRAPEAAAMITEHSNRWSVNVQVLSRWDTDSTLKRRSFGDDPRGTEQMVGGVFPLLKTLRVVEAGRSRKIVVAGFLMSQRKAMNQWSGITARVQNVAVEEHTFFDVTNDPGFRRYITGEVFIFGDVDTSRLINIDRASFNRESADYKVLQRYMSGEIQRFKTMNVQQPRRRRMVLKKDIEKRIAVFEKLRRVADAIDWGSTTGPRDALKRLPSASGIGTPTEGWVARSISELDAKAIVDPEIEGFGYTLSEVQDADLHTVAISESLESPTIRLGTFDIRVEVVALGELDPPILVSLRPRILYFNVSNPSMGHDASRAHEVFAIEMASLLSVSPTEMRDRALAHLAAC